MIDDRRDRLIRAALTPSAHVVAPADLAAAISIEIRQVPQRRRPWLGRITVARPTGPLRVALVLAAVLLAVVVALGVASRLQTPPPSIGSYHGPPSRTGVMPGPAPIGPPVELWRAPLSGPVGVLGMPLVADRTVLVGDDRGRITAVTESGGGLIWAQSFERPGSVSLAIAGDLLIAGGERGQLSAIERATGSRVWAVQIGAGGTLNAVADRGIVIVASTDSHVYGVDPRTGGVRWTLQAAGAVARGAAVADGIGVVGDDAGRVTAFDVATGAVLHTWELLPGEITTPAIDAGTAYVAHGFADGSPAVLVALDLADGGVRSRWTLPNAGRLFVGGVSGTFVIALDDLGTAWRVDTATGAATRLYQAKGAFGSVGAIVGDELILTSADGAIVAIDRTTGASHWSFHVDGVPTTPSVIDGRVFVALDVGVLLALGDPPPVSP